VQIVYLPASGSSGAPTGRFGFVVSRKAMRRAVDRNRFRRVVRERLRLMHGAASRFDLVIRVKRAVDADAVDAAAGEAVALIERLLVPDGDAR
jgi:ribonuclease P protein component